MVRARVSRGLSDEIVLRLANYLRSDCNKIGVTGSISVRRIPGAKSPQAISVLHGLRTFILEPPDGDQDCPLLLRQTGVLVI